jgi:hypothetical protein
VRVAILALSGAAWDLHDQRRLALDQALEVVADVVGIGELRQSFAAREQLMHGLRAAQQQQPQQCDLRLRQAEERAGAVFVAFRARREHLLGQPLRFQRAQGVMDLAGIQRHHRFARRLLVGGDVRGVGRQRVGVGRGGFLLDQAAERACFGGTELRHCGFVGHRGLHGHSTLRSVCCGCSHTTSVSGAVTVPTACTRSRGCSACTSPGGCALHRFQRAGSCTLTVPAPALATVTTALPS